MFNVPSFLKARWLDNTSQTSGSSANSGLSSATAQPGVGRRETSAKYAEPDVSTAQWSARSTSQDDSTTQHRTSQESVRPLQFDVTRSRETAESAGSKPAAPAAFGQLRSTQPEPLGSPQQRFQRVRELSRGGTGFVQEVIDTATGQHVAVKFIPRSAAGYDPTAVSGELLNQRLCAGHPNIIQLQEVFLTEQHLCLVMDLADGGDLSSTIDRLRLQGQRGMPEADARWLFQQLLVAVEYCHLLGIANRDVKLDNMLLHGGGLRPLLKLCDFGFSRVEVATKQCDSSCGTPEYMAPEVLFEEEYNGKVADVWSVGVSLYVLLTGTFPFKRPEDSKANNVVRLQRMFIRIINADFAPVPWLSPEGRDLVARLLNPDPKARMTVTDALRHPWVARDMPPQLAELNRRLLVSGGPGAFSCAPGMPAAASGSAAAFRQTPVQLVQLVRQGSRRSSDLTAEASPAFPETPRAYPVSPQHAQRGGMLGQCDSLDLQMAESANDPLSRLLGFR